MYELTSEKYSKTKEICKRKIPSKMSSHSTPKRTKNLSTTFPKKAIKKTPTSKKSCQIIR